MNCSVTESTACTGATSQGPAQTSKGGGGGGGSEATSYLAAVRAAAAAEVKPAREGNQFGAEVEVRPGKILFKAL